MITDRVADYLCDRMTIELPHQVRAVRLGCFEADSQNVRNFLAALALRQELYDFSLPCGYLRKSFLACLWPFTWRCVHHLLGHSWGEEGFIRQKRLHTGYKITARICLEDISTHTHAHEFVNQLVGLVYAQNKNLRTRAELYYLPGCIKPIQGRHADVQNSHVRLELFCFGHRIPSVCHFGHYLPSGLLLNQRTESSSNNFVVICY